MQAFARAVAVGFLARLSWAFAIIGIGLILVAL